MSKHLPFREVHLDFHTSEKIPEIGADFSKEQFQAALKKGHVDSITVFAKCHHGMFYYPSEKFATHPHLKRNLLQEMLDACHEIGVNAPVYLSAGLDDYAARVHPEWMHRGRENKADALRVGFRGMCFNTPYLDYLKEQVEEVVRNFDCDGIFLDIVRVHPCFCNTCVAQLYAEGKDPYNDDDCYDLARRIQEKYYKTITDAIHAIKPDMRVFHNQGNIDHGDRKTVSYQSHLELESLPTSGWGYDHFPFSIRYCQQLKDDCLGMTGKFHRNWGEFGGFKHPNALIYETALSIANGAKCSVGDQLHPLGFMDEATYDLIGKAYSRVEEREAWCENVKSVADIAILPEGRFRGRYDPNGSFRDSYTGANRIMLEGKYLYDVVDDGSDLSKYKVLIVTDNYRISPARKEKLDAFVANGGKLICAGTGGFAEGEDRLVYDLGADVKGKNKFSPDYFRPMADLKDLKRSAFLIETPGFEIEATGETFAERLDPYFNRSAFAFCSHKNTPFDLRKGGKPAVTLGRHGAYLSWDLFGEYVRVGCLPVKELLISLIDRVLGEAKTLRTDLPAQGVTTLMHQEAERRYVNHLLYAINTKRGEKTEIIEDIPTVYGVSVSVKIPEKVQRVYLAPENREIPFTQENGVVSYDVPELWCHAMAVIDY